MYSTIYFKHVFVRCDISSLVTVQLQLLKMSELGPYAQRFGSLSRVDSSESPQNLQADLPIATSPNIVLL